jgi:D-tagatose-1,6-bisphosphate aldolase subunit GatZ/KbaZ
MSNLNPLFNMVEKRQNGIHSGIPSFCSANKIVIEAILEQAKRFDDDVLIEATSNQVNQFGGYIGMTPAEFRDYVFEIADKINFNKDKIFLGGDHLGPQPWQSLDADIAMENSKELIRLCVDAGYIKIHLDTSMRLGSDSITEPLSDETIAERGAILMEVAENAYQNLLKRNPSAVHPVFVIGSEVPTPGGTQEDVKELIITHPEAFENTILAYKKKFRERNLMELWKYVIAVVVQPGVEFGSADISHYDREKSSKLCRKLNEYPNIVFEGHSTDYQSHQKLKEMVEDGIAIIKVGPALTYALREAIFALSKMEEELLSDTEQHANFIEVLESVMTADPQYWEKYYLGTESEKRLARQYSFFDRSRYYFNHPDVVSAMDKLFHNLDSVEIPIYIIHQYMPLQYVKVRDGKLNPSAFELAKDSVVMLVEDYNYAVKQNYMVR